MSQQPGKYTIQAWINLHRAHRHLLDTVETALKKADLPPLDWYDVLLELQRDKQNGLRQFEIGEKVLLNKHNLSRLIDRLEQQKLLARYACAEDGRGNRIKITESGEKILKKIWPIYSQVIQQAFADKLTVSETASLTKILDKLLSTDINERER